MSTPNRLPVGDLSCAVLGAQGFIGSHLCQRRALEVSRPSSGIKVFKKLARVRVAPASQLPVSDAALVDQLANVDVVFHIAGSTHPRDAPGLQSAFAEQDVAVSKRLLSACVNAQVKKLVFLSSGGLIYGDGAAIPIHETCPTSPPNAYARSKAQIEALLEDCRVANKLNYTVLRMANVYGPPLHGAHGRDFISTCMRSVLSREAFEVWGDGTAIRDFVYIQDAIDALLRAAHCVGPERVFNIGSGHGLMLLDVMNAISKTVGQVVRPRFVAADAHGVAANVLACGRARHLLGWSATTTLHQGLTATWASLNRGTNHREIL